VLEYLARYVFRVALTNARRYQQHNPGSVAHASLALTRSGWSLEFNPFFDGQGDRRRPRNRSHPLYEP
jgi:hypothetical protein